MHAHEIENKKTIDAIVAKLTPEQLACIQRLAMYCSAMIKHVIANEKNALLQLQMRRDLESSALVLAMDLACACALKDLNVFQMEMSDTLDQWHNIIEIQRCINRVDMTFSDDINLRHANSGVN